MSDTSAQSVSAADVDVKPEPLYIDTGAFFAYYNDRDKHHESARAVFRAIRTGELAYDPLYTTQFVLGELATLLLHKIDHETASRALGDIRTAESFNIERVSRTVFEESCAEFDQYDDHEITLVDQVTTVLARNRDVDHVFAYDSDFSTLGFVRVPLDTGHP